jgi:hypothetical protein
VVPKLLEKFMSNAVEQVIYMPCGGTALFDGDFSYRCMDCMAVIGSIGQPDHCKEESDKYEVLKALGAKGWDYKKGVPA